LADLGIFNQNGVPMQSVAAEGMQKLLCVKIKVALWADQHTQVFF
jgi:hypothetical protein